MRVEDASFRWGGTADAAAATEENPLITESDPNERGLTLRGVDLRMAPGTLTLVVGVTGGGKSSLLAALLGEIRRVKGRVRVGGSTAYCPAASLVPERFSEGKYLFWRCWQGRRALRRVHRGLRARAGHLVIPWW